MFVQGQQVNVARHDVIGMPLNRTGHDRIVCGVRLYHLYLLGAWRVGSGGRWFRDNL